MQLSACPQCGADWRGGQTCEDHFHQMLFWEAQSPANWEVHHLMVLCYHLQHPSLYSEDGLRHGRELLEAFIIRGITPREARENTRETVSSTNRRWKVTARPDSIGAYTRPVNWTMTAADVVSRGSDAYISSVYAWAQSVYDALRQSEAAS